jgi:Tfp pilus assembly protein PilZ
MQQRAFERVPANITIRFYSCNTDYSGTIKNLSENGMFISTEKMLFPFDSTIEIIVPFEEKLLKVPVKVVRMTKTDDVFDGIGVALLDNHQDYLELVSSLKDVSA